jgi:predicted nucleic acid-binding protein
MKTRVLDSWAILEWINNRQPATKAALAQKYNCPLVTGDAELRPVGQLELDWIGGLP